MNELLTPEQLFNGIQQLPVETQKEFIAALISQNPELSVIFHPLIYVPTEEERREFSEGADALEEAHTKRYNGKPKKSPLVIKKLLKIYRQYNFSPISLSRLVELTEGPDITAKNIQTSISRLNDELQDLKLRPRLRRIVLYRWVNERE